ncbi:MAG TPA: DUF4388 domain-containing protein [Candidatus Deferrimicrobiaceae bacterium]|jgi:hypothetical protein
MKGKISDFSIPDIFQLVSSQGKSGSLKIYGNDRETEFLFSDGQIVDVRPDRRDPSGMLGTMLVDAGLITGEQLRKILSAEQRGGKKLGEYLVEKRMVSGETIARYLSLQIRESLFETLKLTDGEYGFEGFAVRPPSWMKIPVRADVLMMEGMQYLDEYQRYRERFPPGDFRVVRRRGAKVEAAALSEEERRVWRAIEFSQEPQRIFRKACMTWFEGVKGLWLLQDRGLVEVFAEEGRREDPERTIKELLARNRRIGYLRAGAWMFAAALTAFWAYVILLSPAATNAFARWIRFF